MGIKVVKFGGSSVADAIQLQKTKEIITSDADRKMVIVSAPGKRFDGDTKITDLLYLCKTHIEHNLPYEQLFQVVCDRFRVTEVNLGVTVDLNETFYAEMTESLAALLDEMYDTSVPFRRTCDETLCGYCDFKNICGR